MRIYANCRPGNNHAPSNQCTMKVIVIMAKGILQIPREKACQKHWQLVRIIYLGVKADHVEEPGRAVETVGQVLGVQAERAPRHGERDDHHPLRDVTLRRIGIYYFVDRRAGFNGRRHDRRHRRRHKHCLQNKKTNSIINDLSNYETGNDLTPFCFVALPSNQNLRRSIS